MGPNAARKGDPLAGVDVHIVMIPTPGGEVPTPIPHPFAAKITASVSKDVNVNGKPAATVSSQTENSPSHVPLGPRFQKQPTNKGAIQVGSKTVMINGKSAARVGDTVMTCADPSDAPNGTIISGSPTVFIA